MDKVDFDAFKSCLPDRVFVGRKKQKTELGKILSKLGGSDEIRKNLLEDAIHESELNISINDSNLKNFKEGSAHHNLYYAFYYFLHVQHWETEYPYSIDKLIFKRDFEEEIGRPVKHSRPKTHLIPNLTTDPNLTPLSLVTDPTEDTLLNPLNHSTVKLVGRDEEWQKLRDFASLDDKFQICALIGPSGAGKTRLATEWMAESRDELGWSVGFLQNRDPQIWNDWLPSANTIIVIDYIFDYDRAIKAIIERAEMLGENMPFNVRLLAIDHVIPDTFKELATDLRWKTPLGGPSKAETRTSIFFESSPIRLSEATDRIDILRNLISHRSGIEDTRDERVERALTTLKEMGDAAQHPLFALVIGQAIADDEADYTKWNRRELIYYYLSSENRLPWSGDDANGIWSAVIVAIATMRRGAPYSPIFQNIPDRFIENATQRNDVKRRCQYITSSLDDELLNPFEPDIMGESFFLLLTEELKLNKNVEKFFFNYCCARIDKKSERDRGVTVFEFFQRLIRNLVNDNQIDPKIQTFWESLDDFLQPNNFSEHTMLRALVSMVRSEAAFQLYQNERHSQAMKFLNNIEYNGLISDASKSLKDIAVICLCKVYESSIYGTTNIGRVPFLNVISRYSAETETSRSFYKQCIEYNFYKTLDLILSAITKNKEDFYSFYSRIVYPLLHAACELGKHEVVKVFLKNGFDPNEKAADEGVTPLIIASLYGERDISELLVNKGADPNLGTETDGFTPLMAASQNGYQDIVELLISNHVALDETRKTNGFTALMAASYNGRSEIVSLLLNSGANPDLASHLRDKSALMLASAQGHEATVQALINHGVKVDQSTPEGITSLMIASEYNHVNVLRVLLSHGADPNLTMQPNGTTALMLAAERGLDECVACLLEREWKSTTNPNLRLSNTRVGALDFASAPGHTKAVELLLEAGADPNSESMPDTGSPLHMASGNGKASTVQVLLNGGANPNLGTISDGSTPLMVASEMNHKDVVALLLDRGANPNLVTTDDGQTALMAASYFGHQDVVSILLEHGADPNSAKSSAASTALLNASIQGYEQVVELLLENGARTDSAEANTGFTALFLAATNGFDKIVTLLLAKGANAQHVTEDGMTPFLIACQNDFPSIVQLFLDNGSAPNQTRNIDGVSGLVLASAKGHEAVCRILLEGGADPDQATIEGGHTPLSIVCVNGSLPIAQFLLEAGASPNLVRMTDGATPLNLASQYGHEQIAKLLIEHRSDLNQARNSDGATSLVLASANGHEAICRLLLERGAYPDQATTQGGHTPLSVVCGNGSLPIAKLLLEAGASPNLARLTDGATPLDLATRSGHEQIAKLLTKDGAIGRSGN
ncbi:ankyrin repeat domain-containing protein [Nisaea nitritireducens]|uniref:ankyrin repeat domain-containing protein n=1 Tax=Nisaea nitritireducens TaxID=568392 RepID=UPI00186912F6|nr:ankyrin repeat domain-containing protein [Nisaea nitritireducens]